MPPPPSVLDLAAQELFTGIETGRPGLAGESPALSSGEVPVNCFFARQLSLFMLLPSSPPVTLCFCGEHRSASPLSHLRDWLALLIASE